MKDKLYNEYFNIDAIRFRELGIYNGFINRDSCFYIVPHKLENSAITEFKNSYTNLNLFWNELVQILINCKNKNDIFFRNAKKKLIFHESAFIGLGYSKNSNYGSGIGEKIAEDLATTSLDLVTAGITNPEIFQLIGILEEGIGADRISDMTISILSHDFLMYTQNMSKKLNIPTREYQNFNIPFYNDSPIIFCPEEILVSLPIAFDAEDISEICSHNDLLRAEVNAIIGSAMGKGLSKSSLKSLLKTSIIKDPESANSAINKYKKCGDLYDFVNDPDGIFSWKAVASEFTGNYPLTVSERDSFDLVKVICNKFKELIENNGLAKLLYDDNGRPRNESFARLVFFGIADSYCESNNLDISPECDSGKGPVDFKFSNGYVDRINVEVKLSKNSKLFDGYSKQLNAYNTAGKTNKSIYLVIQTQDGHSKRIEKLLGLGKQQDINIAPEVIVIDGVVKPSASHL